MHITEAQPGGDFSRMFKATFHMTKVSGAWRIFRLRAPHDLSRREVLVICTVTRRDIALSVLRALQRDESAG